MSGEWKEVVRLSFKGERFRDHAFDLTALNELVQFQKMVGETAKALWRAANPDRERLPARFEARTRLCLRKIEAGSAVAPLEVFNEEASQPDLFEADSNEIQEAVALACNVFSAIEREVLLPDKFSRSLLPEYERLGQSLGEREEIEIGANGKKLATVSQKSRRLLNNLIETRHESHVAFSGEVLEVDLRRERFQLWLNENTGLVIEFSSQQEDEVTSALKDHRTRKLVVKGECEFSPEGKPLRMTKVKEWYLQPVAESSFDESVQPIEEILAKIAAEVPTEDWDALPADLTENLDFYLYGPSKK